MICEVCNKSFNDVNLVFRHLKVFHSREKSHNCIYSTCLRNFSCIGTLKKHAQSCIKKDFPTVNNVNKPVNNPVNKRSVEQQSEMQKKKTGSSFTDNNVQQNGNIVNNSNEKTVDENLLEKFFHEFVAKLYSNSTITNTVVDDIVDDVLQFTKQLSTLFYENLKLKLPEEFHSVISDSLNTNIFDKSNTHFKRLQFFKNAGYLIQAKQHKIGKIIDDKKSANATIFIRKICLVYVIPLRHVLKMFFELPNVFRETIANINKEFCKPENIHSTIYNSARWRAISSNFKGKIVIALYLYYDDFEINDPLSTAANIYKIGGLYFSIAGLPLKFASMLENVFLAQFNFTSDLKTFKNEQSFHSVIEKLKYLFNEGILINVDGQTYKVHFIVAGILGDNLGANTLFGFSESFSAEYYCRFCKATKHEAKILCVEKEELMRDVDNYKIDVTNKTHGVKDVCASNELPLFHNILNVSVDLMHDFYLGVCRYDIAKILNYFINEKQYLSYDKLNDRLKFFDHSDTDRGSKISSINPEHIKKGYIIITASQMSYLVSYLCIIIGDLIPPDDLAWELYLMLFEIIFIITSNEISNDEIIVLKELIKGHNALYLKIFKEPLKPKFHIITHYISCIKATGPPKHTSCEKYEAYHKKSKKYARSVNSRVNILLSLATKLQLGLAYRLYCNKGFKTIIEFGKRGESTIILNCKNSYEVSHVKVNGTKYMNQNVIFLRNNCEDEPVFGIIFKIIREDNKFYLLCRQCNTIGYIGTIQAYQIALPKTDCVIKHDVQLYRRPIKMHVTADGRYVISRRDVM